MSQRILHKLSVGGGSVAILLALALSLTHVFGGEATADDGLGEPLDTATSARLQGTHLDFIAESGRVVVNEHGNRQIIWDPPQLPTLEESIRMVARAAEASDTDLLPLCTQEYLETISKS